VKIAFIVNRFPMLSETFIVSQITGLMDRGHEVDIFAGSPGDTERFHPEVVSYGLLERTRYLLDVPRSPLRRYLTLLSTFVRHMFTRPRACVYALLWVGRGQAKYSLNLFYIMKGFLPCTSYDVVHCHFGPSGVRGALLKRLGVLRGKLVTTYYGHDVTRYPLKFGRDVYRQLFDTGDLFLVLSERMKRQLVALGCDERLIKVQHIGVDCQRLSCGARELKKDRPLHILTIGRFVEKKGIEYAVGAVGKLKDVGLQVDYRIVGGGPLFDSVREIIRKRGLEDCVHLLGWKNSDEVGELLADTDVLLTPSVTAGDGDEEGTPTVLMEAMACEVSVVSTFHSGIPEVVKDGVTGWLVPERDVDALAEKLTHLIEHPDVRSEMGRKGRAVVEHEFNRSKLNDRLVELYNQLRDEA
jgi:colanic acid/amylovoran biosynthesis glycosyltransferase